MSSYSMSENVLVSHSRSPMAWPMPGGEPGGLLWLTYSVVEHVRERPGVADRSAGCVKVLHELPRCRTHLLPPIDSGLY